MRITSKSAEIGGKALTLEVGRFAEQASQAVLARYGDTMVLATVVSAKAKVDLGYFPLSVEYMERLYAGGKIKGSRWVKREGRPSDEAILTARLVDRSIRPLFPSDYKNEVQVIVTVLSVDAENDADIPAICAVSAALQLSDIPWDGPVGAVRVGIVSKDGGTSFITNPTYQDLQYSDMDLIVSGNESGVIMIEGGANIVPEETVLSGIEYAEKEITKVIELIKDLQKEAGKKKQVYEKVEIDAKVAADIEKEVSAKVEQVVIDMASKKESFADIEELITVLVEKYKQDRSIIAKIVDDLVKKTVRGQILDKGVRLDGRKPTEIRPITIEAGVLPRTHGSAMFKRGATQALTITTLGSPSLGQLIESMEGEETKRYIHHYNMPPFSVGEAGRIGSPSRREIGHGALAERALIPVIPSEDKFPYTIQVVSEIMSSNGSTSMASVCGSTLSLMDAGVPIKNPVSGIAMGMVKEGNKKVILSDIIGMEDFNGDMDFKVAGTKDGVTAIQMDVKKARLAAADFKAILDQAHVGRLFILDKMMAVLPEGRAKVSIFAPKISVVHVPVEKIGEVIGPGGRMIRQIISETGAEVEIEDDGKVSITATDQEAVDKAVARVEGLTREVQAGEIYEGTVKRVQPFGAFVEILPGKEGLVHVSRMAKGYVGNPADIVKLGDKVQVKVSEIDDLGRINLTMVLDDTGEEQPPRREFRPRRDFDRRPRR